LPRINDDTQAYPSDWVRDNPLTTTERMTMNEKERTITKHELSAVLLAIDIKVSAMKDVMDAAFPPPFTPKKGEAIQVSDFKDFSNIKVRVFSHMNDDTGTYECVSDGAVNNTITWLFAKPQTPTQKGE
jgi:hypothetical protein